MHRPAFRGHGAARMCGPPLAMTSLAHGPGAAPAERLGFVRRAGLIALCGRGHRLSKRDTCSKQRSPARPSICRPSATCFQRRQLGTLRLPSPGGPLGQAALVRLPQPHCPPQATPLTCGPRLPFLLLVIIRGPLLRPLPQMEEGLVAAGGRGRGADTVHAAGARARRVGVGQRVRQAGAAGEAAGAVGGAAAPAVTGIAGGGLAARLAVVQLLRGFLGGSRGFVGSLVCGAARHRPPPRPPWPACRL